MLLTSAAMLRLALFAALLALAGAFMAPLPAARAPAARAPAVTMIRHANKLKKLNRPADQRKAMMRSLTTELIRHGRIRTTLRRCKEVRTTADHMIGLAKDGSLHARRQALGFMYDKELVHAMFESVGERYDEQDGGYTRVLRDGYRKGDNSEMGIIEVRAPAPHPHTPAPHPQPSRLPPRLSPRHPSLAARLSGSRCGVRSLY